MGKEKTEHVRQGREKDGGDGEGWMRKTLFAVLTLRSRFNELQYIERELNT